MYQQNCICPLLCYLNIYCEDSNVYSKRGCVFVEMYQFSSLQLVLYHLAPVEFAVILAILTCTHWLDLRAVLSDCLLPTFDPTTAEVSLKNKNVVQDSGIEQRLRQSL